MGAELMILPTWKGASGVEKSSIGFPVVSKAAGMGIPWQLYA